MPRGANALWVGKDTANAPLHAQRWCTLDTFMSDPRGMLKDVNYLIVVGLVSAITTPANRVKTGQWFTDPLPGITRYSIDDKLFITEPWRLWWHFGCIGVPFNNCHVSYSLESRWKAWRERRSPDPCAPAIVATEGKGRITAPDPFRFDKIDINITPVTEADHTDYLKEKEVAFSEETTLSGILSRLVKFAQRVYPSRRVPTERALFNSTQVDIDATDLGIDRFLLEELRNRIELTNFVANEFAP